MYQLAIWSVTTFCEEYNRDFDKVKKWYDGYLLNRYQVYNPKAVVSVMTKGRFRSYWSETGLYEVVVPLICMNYDGMKNAIIEMLSGSEVKVDTATFKNDPAKIQNRDDVITYLIYLGYLGYNEDNETAFVPNEEIRQELITAVRSSNWDEVIALELKWNKDTETAIQQIKNKRYPESVFNYTGDILLVGINYDTHSKAHQCLIEKYRKN